MSLARLGLPLQMQVVGAKGLGWDKDFGNGGPQTADLRRSGFTLRISGFRRRPRTSDTDCGTRSCRPEGLSGRTSDYSFPRSKENGFPAANFEESTNSCASEREVRGLMPEVRCLRSDLFQHVIVQLFLAPVGGGLDESEDYGVRVFFCG